MKRYFSLVLLLLITMGVAFAAQAEEPKQETEKNEKILTYAGETLTPDQEKAMILERREYLRDVARFQYVQAVNFQAAVYAAMLEQAQYDEQQRSRVADAVERTGGNRRASEPGNGTCGGNLPPCYVMQRESGGDIRAENPVSTASGKWQFIDGTWGGYGGYSHASDAPEDVQDARAAEVWANGAGCSNWSAC
jgi:hypothetical protein